MLKVIFAHCSIDDKLVKGALDYLPKQSDSVFYTIANPRDLPRTKDEEDNRYFAKEKTLEYLEQAFTNPEAVAIVSRTVFHWIPEKHYKKVFHVEDDVRSMDIAAFLKYHVDQHEKSYRRLEQRYSA